MNALPYIITASTISLFTDIGPLTTTADNPKFEHIIDLIKEKNWDEAILALSPAKRLSIYLVGSSTITLDNNTVYYNREAQHGYLPSKILAMAADGFDILPLACFLDKLYATPSKRIKEGLYEFLERGQLPLTPTGNILGYRTVRNDFTDWHTGTFDNSVGQTLEMPRNYVDDDADKSCSFGFHICSQEYLRGFHYGEGRNIVVEFDPGDVVSFPKSDTTKLRVCKYKVVAELPHSPESKNIWNKEIVDDYNPYGYNSDGYNSDGYDSGNYDSDGYDSDGYDSDGYDSDGYDPDGYDSDGYDPDDYDSDGYDRDGYDRDGYNVSGNHRR